MPLAYYFGSIASFIVALGTSRTAFTQNNQDYNDQLLKQGEQRYAQHCSVCHGDTAESTAANWHQRDENGRFSPPPLNGAHIPGTIPWVC